jgi:hypothetical protein
VTIPAIVSATAEGNAPSRLKTAERTTAEGSAPRALYKRRNRVGGVVEAVRQSEREREGNRQPQAHDTIIRRRGDRLKP